MPPVLTPGGTLYFSVPIGTQRLEFDAHHVFAPTTILDAFQPLRLASFAMVDDFGDFTADAVPDSFSGWYSRGLFVFTAPRTPK